MTTKKRLIDTNAALEKLCEHCACGNYEECDFRCSEFENISNIPAVDAVEVVHGWWDKYEDDKFIGYDANGRIQYRKVYTYYCGRCGRGTAVKTNYCPNCGADMRDGDGNA